MVVAARSNYLQFKAALRKAVGKAKTTGELGRVAVSRKPTVRWNFSRLCTDGIKRHRTNTNLHRPYGGGAGRDDHREEMLDRLKTWTR